MNQDCISRHKAEQSLAMAVGRAMFRNVTHLKTKAAHTESNQNWDKSYLHFYSFYGNKQGKQKGSRERYFKIRKAL